MKYDHIQNSKKHQVRSASASYCFSSFSCANNLHWSTGKSVMPAWFVCCGLCHLNPVLDISKYLMCTAKDDLLQDLITALSARAPVIPPLQDKGNDFHIHLELWKASVGQNLFEKREICASWQYKAVKRNCLREVVGENRSCAYYFLFFCFSSKD